ncbi:MAG TPA: Fur family transcriptional regulator [Alphaproteobacteria bacterium]|jgi:Fur family zinc uptake transcriptional regulator
MAQRRPSLPPALSRGHDHHQCVHDALEAADQLCASRDVRLTEVRRRVLELIWASHAPVGAYAIMDLLRGEGRNAMPPTVYRALDFLLEQGLIHRIASLNAYIGCSHPGDAHAMQYLICKKCGTVAEIDDPAIDKAIAATTETLGFALDSQTVEVAGVCRDCRDATR